MSIYIIENGHLLSLQSGHYPQLQIGPDASKSSSPSVGDQYIATDNAKTYSCYISGIWTLVESQGYEEYSNHLGTVDNFTQKLTLGNGTAVTNASTHSMDLSTGTTNLGYAIYATKDQYTPSASQRLIAIFKLQNIVAGSGGLTNYFFIGFKLNFTSVLAQNFIGLYHTSGGLWFLVSADLGVSPNMAAYTPQNGDIIEIVVTPSSVQVYVNGSLIGYTTEHIPTAAMYAGVSTNIDENGMQNAGTISVDFIKVKRY